MSQPTGHPEELLQYVASTLPPEAAARVAEHLNQCHQCSLEAESLLSMRQSLLRQSRSGHIPIEELVAYEEGAPALDRSIRGRLRAHLEECAACRADLQALGEASRSLSERRHPAARWGVVAAAAGGAFVALWIVQSLRTQQIPVSASHQAQSVVFAPARRGGEAVPRLSGDGPWEIKVLLPIDAPEGAYRYRLAREDGTPLGGPSEPLAGDGQGAIDFSLDLLPPPGDYRLILVPETPAAGDSYIYPFSVTAASRSPGNPGP